MSDTPKLADESKKLLDSGWVIVLHGNGIGSYSGTAIRKDLCEPLFEALREIDPDPECESEEEDSVRGGYCVTDDFEPSQVLYRLTEKVHGNIV